MEQLHDPSLEEITLQEQRILNYSVFKNSPILTRFLRFIVSETVVEKVPYIKEYSIAVNVLNRPKNFNPHDDAVVRIHAGRLRRALGEYYLSEGKNDPLIIDVPKGGYVPKFLPAVPHAIVSAGWSQHILHPVVSVFPFKAIPQTPAVQELADTLCGQLSAELSRFHDLSVIGYYSSEVTAKIAENMLEAATSVNADYVLTGSLHINGQMLQARVNLLMAKTGKIVMTECFEKEILSEDIFETLNEVTQAIIGFLSGYYGIIFQEMAEASPQKVFNNYSTWKGICAYYKYQRSYSAANYDCALATLEQSVKDFPDQAVSWAMLAELYLNGMGLGMKNIKDPLSKGFQCITQCLDTDPFCQHGWYALSLFHLLSNEKKACIDAARHCIQLNPNNAAMVCGAAVILFYAGRFEESGPIMERAIKLSPHYPWWINGGYSLYYLYKKDYASALLWAEKMNSSETFWYPLLKSVALSYLNKKDDAETYLLKLLLIEPDIQQQLQKKLSTLILSEELTTDIVLGLKQVGLQLTSAVYISSNAN